MISDAISVDGDQLHVPVLPERPTDSPDRADRLWKNMTDRQDVVMWPRHLVAYCSPEQMMGKELREPSHVYSIGVITYELLTKRVPFPDAKGPAGLITAQLKTEPLAPSTHADVPRAVDQLVLRCLRKMPAERFDTLDALTRAIDELFD